MQKWSKKTTQQPQLTLIPNAARRAVPSTVEREGLTCDLNQTTCFPSATATPFQRDGRLRRGQGPKMDLVSREGVANENNEDALYMYYLLHAC